MKRRKEKTFTYLLTLNYGDDDFALAIGIASNMTGELLHVRH